MPAPASPPTLPPDTRAAPATSWSRGAMPPLVPVLLPLVLAAIVLSAVFAWLFPPPADDLSITPARWTDITDASGLAFVHQQGIEPSPTTLGAGLALIDYDRDGDLDVFFVNGAPWPWEEPDEASVPPTCALYRNTDGRFEDVSVAAGVALSLQGMAVAVGDYDRDGWPDLFLTAVGEDRLLRNQGDGTFVDVTAAAGVGGDLHAWSTGAAWVDTDADGDLDLVVCQYARWPREIDLELAFKIAGVGRSYGAPAGFVSAPPVLYRNRGDGTFEDAGEASGLRNLDPQTNLPRALTLAVTPIDANSDSRMDLLFVHQTSDEVLFLAQADGSFREWRTGLERRNEGAVTGLAASGGFPLAPSLAQRDRFSVLRSLLLEPDAQSAGVVGLNRKLGFALLDFELDGRTEVVLGSGRLEPDMNRFDHGRDFIGALHVVAERGGQWRPVPAAEGDPRWQTMVAARGIAVGDLDGDGDGDLIVTQHNGPAKLWRNDQRTGAPWLRVDLQATPSAPGAGGARVEVHTPRRVHLQTVAPAVGFFAQSESILTFGLGDDARVRRVVVNWPSGQRQEIKPEGVNRVLTVREPRADR